MFVEERCYRLLPGAAQDYLLLYERRGMAVQRRYLPTMLGYYLSEIGDLNEIVHLWGHDSLDAREANRHAMRQDPDFQAYWSAVRPLIVRQKTRILRPAPFFVDALRRMAAAALPDA